MTNASPSPAPVELTDSHAHLDYPPLAGNLDGVIAAARAAGVTHILTVGTALGSARRCLEIAQRYHNVRAAAAIHPNEAAEHFGEFDELKRLFAGGGFVAVGETGLDSYRQRTAPDVQEMAFRAHIDLALELDLPVIIHIRDAYERALSFIDCLPKVPRGVLHCFSGTAEFAREALDRGFYISIAGQVTYKNADALRSVAAGLPLDRLLVETDCPYLAPVPYRGKDNQPAYVRFTAEKVAQVMGATFEDVARATSANAAALFGFPKRAS